MGTMQDKLGRWVVNAECVGLSFCLAGHGAAGERTERGKLPRCSGPKKQNAGRPLLFGRVDASIVALTVKAGAWPSCNYSTVKIILRSTSFDTACRLGRDLSRC